MYTQSQLECPLAIYIVRNSTQPLNIYRLQTLETWDDSCCNPFSEFISFYFPVTVTTYPLQINEEKTSFYLLTFSIHLCFYNSPNIFKHMNWIFHYLSTQISLWGIFFSALYLSLIYPALLSHLTQLTTLFLQSFYTIYQKECYLIEIKILIVIKRRLCCHINSIERISSKIMYWNRNLIGTTILTTALDLIINRYFQSVT